MAALVISTIHATPTLSTRNSAGHVDPPNTALLVWDPLTNYVDGTGSTKPVTFTTPSTNPTPYSPSFSLATLATFTSQYAGQTFDVEGSLPIGLNGAYVTILRNTANVPPTPPPNPPVPVPRTFSGFQFDAGLNLANSCPVPFRFAGDFRWSLVFHQPLPAITAAQTTRLEFSYARAAASAGPSYTVNPLVTQTKVDLSGVYPIGLVRQFFPSPLEFPQGVNFSQSTIYGPWFAARVVQQVWAWGNPHAVGKPQYDAYGGASFYNMTKYGGGFELDNWLRVSQLYCNCYDLAAIIQLGISLLLDSAGHELPASRWVFQQPNGYINQSLLYGWAEAHPYPPGVNNPFFLNYTPNNPYVLPPSLVNREPFYNHCWIEVLPDPFVIGTRTVLDASTGVPGLNNIGVPEKGTRSRTVYKTVHIDTAADPTGGDTGNINNYVLPPPSLGNCFTNYDYYIGSSTFPPNAKGRVGVWNADGINPPALLAGMATMEGPESEIAILLKKAHNPHPPHPVFNNATTKGKELSVVISEGNDNLVFQKSEMKITEGATVLKVIIDGARYAEIEGASLTAEIHVFNKTLVPARAAFAYGLNKYNVPRRLSEYFTALSTPLGDYSLIDIHGETLHVVWGNLYFWLRLIPKGLVGRDRSAIEPLEPIAKRLTDYFAAHSAQPGHQHTPDFHLGAPGSASVRVGEAVVLSAAGDDYALVNGSSSNGAAVIYAGRKEGTDNEVQFYAVGEGEAELSLNVAHKKTLIPATKKWKVTVAAAAVSFE
ncbi:MAG: hypothetical protein M1829_000492 [Trizodia sp. TS-e1964]|nr:MAG: hypothetical protein M1829_000492 [Trizodia sp. TS-e1964]